MILEKLTGMTDGKSVVSFIFVEVGIILKFSYMFLFVNTMMSGQVSENK